MLLKNSFALVCKSFWLKLNSSCIVVNNQQLIIIFSSSFLKSGAKVLLQTDKTCHKLRKKTKKVHFFALFLIFSLFRSTFFYLFCILLRFLMGSLAIHLVCFFCFVSEELDQFLGFSDTNVRTMGTQFLDKVKGRRYEILEEGIPLELAHLFL